MLVAVEEGPELAMLEAVEVQKYVTPGVRPSTMIACEGAAKPTASGCPAARHVAAYWMIGAPPSEVVAIGVYETVTSRSAVTVAATFVGAAWGGLGTNTCFAPDVGPGPATFTAPTVPGEVLPLVERAKATRPDVPAVPAPSGS